MKNLFKNKKGILPRDILINLVMFGMFIGGAFIIVGGMFGSYGTTYVDNSTLYNKIADVSDDVQIMTNSVSSSGASPVGFLEYISTGAWQSLKLIINSGSIIASVVEAIGTEYGIPSVFIFGFITIVSITIIMGIVSAIFRKKT